MKKYNSGLLLMGVATSIIALNSPALAEVPLPSSSTGIFAGAGTLTTVDIDEDAVNGIQTPIGTVTGSVPVVAGTVASGTAAQAAATVTSNAINNALNATNKSDLTAYKAAVANADKAAKAATTASTALIAAQAKVSAATALTSAYSTALVSANTAKANATTSYQTDLATYNAAVIAGNAGTIASTKATMEASKLTLDKKTAEVTALQSAYTTATAAEAAAMTASTATQVASIQATAAATSASALVTAAGTTLNSNLAANTALTAVRLADGGNYLATYQSLAVIIDPTAVVAPIDSYARNMGLLTNAADSKNQNISLASGSLTGSAAAVAAGAVFETEVLGALVDHEGRITTNTAAIATEAQTRANEDTRLNGLIVAETAQRRADVTRLDGRIDALSNRVDQFDRRMRSATAAAVALSGGVFLPNKTANVTFNMGHYDGKSALSAQVNYLVSQNVALNAGVAKGLNKDGKLAIRGGVTFGW